MAEKLDPSGQRPKPVYVVWAPRPALFSQVSCGHTDGKGSDSWIAGPSPCQVNIECPRGWEVHYDDSRN